MIHLDEPLTTDQLFTRTKQRQHLLIQRQVLAVGCALLFGLLFFTRTLEPAERALLDLWFSRPQPAQTPAIVLVPISTKSIKQIGPWPWPPFRHAVILELLQRFGARSVYLDHAFSETWPEEEQKSLVTVLTQHKIPIFFAADYSPRFENFGPGLAVLNQAGQTRMEWVRPIPEVAKFVSFGHRQIKPEQDKVFRFWQPWLKGQGVSYPLAALKMRVGVKAESADHALYSSKETSKRLIPWSQTRFTSWPRIEFSELLQSYLAMREGMQPTVAPEIFKGKDVFIGLADESGTLSGLTPWRQTAFPFEVMAAIFDGLSDSNRTMSRMAGGYAALILLTMVAAMLVAWTGLRVGHVFWGMWFGLFFGVVLTWIAFYFFSIWLPCAATLLFLLVSGAATFVFDALHARQQHSALFHLATRDGLTNLYVIRHFRVIMNQMTREACSRKEDIAVILMDIDHFKKVNDTYGHPAGDMVLKKTADTIQSVVRQKRTFKDIDFVARYGGEEFIVLIRRNALETVAGRIAERIRKAIHETHYEWEGTRLFVTASFGVAILNAGENIPDAMVHRADKALYLAKQNGRNQVCTEDDIRSA